MAGMILSTYVFQCLPSSSFGCSRALVVFISLGFGSDCWFTIKFACPGRRVNATPSWTVLYVGIAVAALTYPLGRHHRNCLCDLEFWFFLTFYLYPLIYSDLKKHPLPLALLGQEGIYCAPFSLLLASLVRVGGAGLPTWLLIVMILASSVLLFLCFDSPAQYFKTRFSTSLLSPHLPNHYHSYLAQDGSGNLETSISGLSGLAETVICLTILFFVLGAYLIWLRKRSS